MAETIAYRLPMTMRFRSVTERQGMIIKGEYGWAEWSPFLEYGIPEAAQWLRATHEVIEMGFPAPLRTQIPVNATIPATDPARAHLLTKESGCRTAKVKVAEPSQRLSDDLARVEAVRDALGPEGKLRVDANGAWDLDQAVMAIQALARFDLEYVEQPCTAVEDLAAIRRRVSVPIAADESIRRASDPLMVKRLEAADVVVLKVQPLGGVRACLEMAEALGMDVVVSSALETSVGLRAGIALAAALPELPYACGLNTATLLGADLVSDPLVAVDGTIEVREVHVDDCLLDAARADEETVQGWASRLDECERYLDRLAARR